MKKSLRRITKPDRKVKQRVIETVEKPWLIVRPVESWAIARFVDSRSGVTDLNQT